MLILAYGKKAFAQEIEVMIEHADRDGKGFVTAEEPVAESTRNISRLSVSVPLCCQNWTALILPGLLRVDG